MPNWITGSLKVRGPYENVKKFFLEGLNVYETILDPMLSVGKEVLVPKEQWFESREYGEPGAQEFDIDIKPGYWAYVEGTKRAFISSSYISVYEIPENNTVTAVCEVNEAWGFHPERWIKISKKYGVDIRLYGLECGMQFGQEVEILS